jgi:hypothetical protein
MNTMIETGEKDNMLWILSKRVKDMEEMQHKNLQVIIELKRQNSVMKEDNQMRERESKMMRDMHEQLMKEIDSRNKQFQAKLEEQDFRGRELENVVNKVQKLEQDEMNKIKRVLHEKVVSDREASEREQEKSRVLFQEVARLGQEVRESEKVQEKGAQELLRKVSQMESYFNENEKRWV